MLFLQSLTERSTENGDFILGENSVALSGVSPDIAQKDCRPDKCTGLSETPAYKTDSPPAVPGNHLQSQLADKAIDTDFFLPKEDIPRPVPWQNLVTAAEEEFYQIAFCVDWPLYFHTLFIT
ncbi:hypothetical protein ACPVCW_005311 [Klebsiella pneumoniae]